MIRRVAATGTPFAVLLENGGPIVVADWIDAAPAVEPELFRLHVGSTLERTQAVELLVR